MPYTAPLSRLAAMGMAVRNRFKASNLGLYALIRGVIFGIANACNATDRKILSPASKSAYNADSFRAPSQIYPQGGTVEALRPISSLAASFSTPSGHSPVFGASGRFGGL